MRLRGVQAFVVAAACLSGVASCRFAPFGPPPPPAPPAPPPANVEVWLFDKASRVRGCKDLGPATWDLDYVTIMEPRSLTLHVPGGVVTYRQPKLADIKIEKGRVVRVMVAPLPRAVRFEAAYAPALRELTRFALSRRDPGLRALRAVEHGEVAAPWSDHVRSRGGMGVDVTFFKPIDLSCWFYDVTFFRLEPGD